MWNIQSTTRLLKEMSQSTEPGELVRLFFEHVRRSVDVQRALVLSSAGLSAPHYRLVQYVNGKDSSTSSAVAMNGLRQGGLLAQLLYLGEFQSISDFSPGACDPALDLLEGSRSLMAFPLFRKGSSVGIVVLLGSSRQPRNAADLCVLATIISMLGRAIETQELADKLDVACRELDSELQAAADVQRWLLPQSTPVVADVSIAASYRAARRSGGDYYDFDEMPDGRLGVLIADVSGKGAAATVLMVVLRTIVHEIAGSRATGPAALLDYADSRLCALGLPRHGRFITAFSCALDPTTGVLTYSSAGHDPPRLLRSRRRIVVPLEKASTAPLGAFNEPCTHAEESVVLEPGDIALLYTDGITETLSPGGEFFGTDRLDGILRELPEPLTPTSAVEAIARAVGDFAGTESLFDDQTMLALGWPAQSGEAGREHEPRAVRGTR